MIAEIAAARIWDGAIVTVVQPYTVFDKAEDDHQNYFWEHASQPYCKVVIAPKVAKFCQLYFEKLQAPA